MKKLLSLLLALALCLSLVPAMADDTVEIELWCNFAGTDYYQVMADKFMAENPNVKVTILEISFWDYGGKLSPNLVTGTAGDIFVNTVGSTATRAQLGQTVAIDKYLAESKYFDASKLSSLETGKVDGVTYALPYTASVQLLYYNKDLFTAAGLDPECPPKTWQEVYEYAEKITQYDENGNVTIAGFSPTYSAAQQPWWYLTSFGVPVMDGETPAFNTPAGVECFEFMLKFNDIISYEQANLLNEVAAQEYQTTNINYFEAGKIGMLINDDTQGPIIKNKELAGNFGVAQIPVGGANTESVAYGDGWCWEFTWHNDEARMQAAVDFAAFMLQYENALLYAKQQGATTTNIAARAEINATANALCDNFYEVVDAAMKTCIVRSDLLAYPQWTDVLGNNWSQMFAGELTAEEALAQAEATIKLEVENYHIFND